MIRWATVLLAGAAVAAGAASAEAAPIPVQTLLTDFNVINNGDFHDTADVQGPLLIGGNINDTSILNSLGLPLAIPITGYGQVNIFGNNSSPGLSPLVGANTVVDVGGTTAPGSFPGAVPGSYIGGYTFPGSGLNNAGTFATDIWAQLTGLSASLSARTANSSLNSNTFTPGATVDATTPAIFSVSLSTLNALTGMVTFGGCIGAMTCDAVIDVTGIGTFNQGFTFPPLDDVSGLPNVIFNFQGATAVNWGLGNFDASILAVDAVAGNNGAGSLVGGLAAASANSLTNPIGGEIHVPPFDCSDNLCTTTVPEPGSLGILGAALAPLGLMRRRRG